MNKIIKRATNIILATAMIAAMCIPAFAAYTQKYKTNVIDLPQKQTVKATAYRSEYSDKTDTSTDTFDMYRIKIPGDGYVKLSTGGGYVSIYKKFAKNADIDAQEPIMYVGGSATSYIVLPKGTYYLHANTSMKLRWTFFQAEGDSNFCRANAKVIAANKEKVCTFSYKREHSRYFRFKVPAKKLCTFTLTRLDTEPGMDAVDFMILDAKGKLVAQPVGGAFICRKTLPAGTYYIKVFRNVDGDDDDYYAGRLAKIRWQ